MFEASPLTSRKAILSAEDRPSNSSDPQDNVEAPGASSRIVGGRGHEGTVLKTAEFGSQGHADRLVRQHVTTPHQSLNHSTTSHNQFRTDRITEPTTTDCATNFSATASTAPASTTTRGGPLRPTVATRPPSTCTADGTLTPGLAGQERLHRVRQHVDGASDHDLDHYSTLDSDLDSHALTRAAGGQPQRNPQPSPHDHGGETIGRKTLLPTNDVSQNPSKDDGAGHYDESAASSTSSFNLPLMATGGSTTRSLKKSGSRPFHHHQHEHLNAIYRSLYFLYTI